jgi:hypothetical protein
MIRLISVVSVVGMSSLFSIGADRADPMPGNNERQGRSANIFLFHEDSLQEHRINSLPIFFLAALVFYMDNRPLLLTFYMSGSRLATHTDFL